MTLYYSLVFLMLLSEMALFFLLTVPVPRSIKVRTLRGIRDLPFLNQIKLYTNFTLVFIAILFIDSVSRVYRAQAEFDLLQAEGGNNMANLLANDRTESQLRRFYAQRNMYLCGSCLFLFFVLRSTFGTTLALLEKDDLITALKKGSDVKVAEGSEVAKLKKELAAKQTDLDNLKKQSAQLTAEYNRVCDELNKNDKVDKKNQ